MIELQGSPGRPLYMHFLNREFSRAVDAEFSVNRCGSYLLLAATISDSTLLSSLALIWESGLLDSEYAEFIVALIDSEQLLLISDFVTLDGFLASCRQLYRHDVGRYPMYFSDIPESYSKARPTVIKTASTTVELDHGIQSLVAGQLDIIRGMPDSDAARVYNFRPSLEKVITNRADRAVTMSLFNAVLGETSVDLSIGRLVALLHLKHYMRFTDADIVTGLPGLEYLDSLSLSYPRFDAWYARRLLAAIGLPGIIRKRYWISLVGGRGSPEHALFLRHLHLLSGGLSYLVEGEVTRAAQLARPARSAILRHLLKATTPADPVSSNSLYDQASSRLSQLLSAVERGHRGIGEYMEKERATSTLVSARVLILVATELERDAVLRAAEEMVGRRNFTRNYLPFHTIFHLGLIGGTEVLLAQSEMGTEGPSSMTLTALDVVDACRPDYLILTGIAFGLRESEQSLGDVLVSTHIRLWDPKKVIEKDGVTSWIIRGDRTSASVTLLDRFRSASVDWPKAKVRFGLMLSANTLVNARDLRARLLQLEPDAMGGEMEGAGIYCVGAKRKTDWIIVKGISDWGHAKQDDSQAMAAANAAAYVIHVLGLGGLAHAPGN